MNKNLLMLCITYYSGLEILLIQWSTSQICVFVDSWRLHLVWRNLSFSKYFFFIYFRIIIWWSFWNPWNFISNFISSEISSCFWISLFEAVLNPSAADCLAWWRNFWRFLILRFLIKYLPIFLAKDKSQQPFTNTRFFGWTE